MKVRDIMTTAPETCGPKTNLASVAAHLWRADCGVLPVIDQDRELIGIITDRDICIALGTRDRPASEVVVDEVMRSRVHTCRAEDDVSVALGLMKEHRVRRLPCSRRSRKACRHPVDERYGAVGRSGARSSQVDGVPASVEGDLHSQFAYSGSRYG